MNVKDWPNVDLQVGYQALSNSIEDMENALRMLEPEKEMGGPEDELGRTDSPNRKK